MGKQKVGKSLNPTDAYRKQQKKKDQQKQKQNKKVSQLKQLDNADTDFLNRQLKSLQGAKADPEKKRYIESLLKVRSTTVVTPTAPKASVIFDSSIRVVPKAVAPKPKEKDYTRTYSHAISISETNGPPDIPGIEKKVKIDPSDPNYIPPPPKPRIGKKPPPPPARKKIQRPIIPGRRPIPLRTMTAPPSGMGMPMPSPSFPMGMLPPPPLGMGILPPPVPSMGQAPLPNTFHPMPPPVMQNRMGFAPIPMAFPPPPPAMQNIVPVPNTPISKSKESSKVQDFLSELKSEGALQ